MRCQMRYPKRCELSIMDKERLEGREKYKAFLMYQFDGNDPYLKETVNDYFKSPLYYVYDTDDVRSLGVKFCKICKLAQACDFGIAVLSPENLNVFMEIGLLIGLGKPCIYIVNESKLTSGDVKKLPFDISDQIVIKYDSKNKLLSELEKEIPVFMMKVQLISGYEKAFREKVIERYRQLTPGVQGILKRFIELGEVELTRYDIKTLLGLDMKQLLSGDAMGELIKFKFITKTNTDIYSIEETYRPILEEVLFNE